MLEDVITSFTVCLLLSEARCVEVRFAESRPARAQLYVGSRLYGEFDLSYGGVYTLVSTRSTGDMLPGF